jgi:hypothetical protein
VKITRFLFVTLAVMLVYPCLLLAYGGGEDATQVEIESGLDSGKICRCKTLDEVQKGQRWHTRPEAMKNTAYEFLDNFPDADRNLMDRYEAGDFTDEEVKDILQWLKDNKMYMSDRALKTLNKLSGTPEGSATKSSKTTSSGKSAQPTASTPGTTTTSSTPEDAVKAMAQKKIFAYLIQCPPLVTNMYDKFKYQNANKNHFELNNMVFRKLFTKKERDLIQSDLKVYIRIMNRIDQLTK